jgi:hypothetical protein
MSMKEKLELMTGYCGDVNYWGDRMEHSFRTISNNCTSEGIDKDDISGFDIETITEGFDKIEEAWAKMQELKSELKEVLK